MLLRPAFGGAAVLPDELVHPVLPSEDLVLRVLLAEEAEIEHVPPELAEANLVAVVHGEVAPFGGSVSSLDRSDGDGRQAPRERCSTPAASAGRASTNVPRF